MPSLNKCPYVRPRLVSLDLKQLTRGQLVARPPKQFRILTGPKMHVMIHLPLGPLRDHIISGIVRSSPMEDQTSVEMVCNSEAALRREIVDEGIIPLKDEVDGLAALVDQLVGKPFVRRFILTGGDQRACVRAVYETIVSLRASTRVEFYFSLDSIFSYKDNGAAWQKIISFLTGYFAGTVKGGASVAFWQDDFLLATASTDPQVRLRLYSSIPKMISALS